MKLGTLGTSLLRNLLQGKGVKCAGDGVIKIFYGALSFEYFWDKRLFYSRERKKRAKEWINIFVCLIARPGCCLFYLQQVDKSRAFSLLDFLDFSEYHENQKNTKHNKTVMLA